MAGKLLISMLFVASIAFVHAGEACEKEKHKGCKLSYSECTCGEAVGCSNPFPYKDMQECLDDKSGKNDACKPKNPCRNDGTCTQLKLDDGTRTWHCECAGTGFHGKRCQHKCPKRGKKKAIPKDYPAACVKTY